MTTIGRTSRAAALGLVVTSGAWFHSTTARGQVVAYQPNVSSILNGAAMQVTPAVSADRRYVRVSVNAYFNTVNGFTTYTAPLGAVSGGGSGGLGGGFAGMSGPIGGVGMAGPMMPMAGYAGNGSYLAGDYPPARMGMGSGGSNDPFGQSGVIPMRAALPNGGPADQGMTGDAMMTDPFGFADAGEGPSLRPSGRTTAAARRQAARKSSRRPATTAKRNR